VSRVLNLLVGQAILDSSFRDALLDGRREEVIRPLHLTVEERALVMAIQANTLEGFASAIEQWLEDHGRDGRDDGPPGNLPQWYRPLSW